MLIQFLTAIQLYPAEDSLLSNSKGIHSHAKYTTLKESIEQSRLPSTVRQKALCILELLAKAEAAVHGHRLDDVVLHEAGSVDSITDIVCAAILIVELGELNWSCDPLPRGNGFVDAEHGQLPLPAPAAVHLLAGYPLYDDGRKGERITPTGAAILRALNPSFEIQAHPMTLIGTGTGFGTSIFPGISNTLRIFAYRERGEINVEKIAVFSFDIDDQSPEELSVGLERLRNIQGVIDVIQTPAIGKKGRMSVNVQILANPNFKDAVVNACFRETATLGVRCQITDRYTLERQSIDYETADSVVPIKLANRPGGSKTAKVESDFLAEAGDYGQRKSLKQKSEQDIESR